MTSKTINPDVYTDFNRFSHLRNLARNESSEALNDAARQFESLFLQMTLKSMREANLGDGLFDNDQSRLYRDMYDKQLSLNLAKNSGLGLAEMIIKQLGGEAKKEASSPAIGRDLEWYRHNTNHVISKNEANLTKPNAADKIETVNKNVKKILDRPINNAEEFVQTLYPYAQRAAKKIGVDPKLLLAQAALETGWGKSLIRDHEDKVSYNLFGIKADGRWKGNKVSLPTLEFSDGVAQRRREDFRVYNSFRESFEDYVRFLESNPRYRKALEHTDNPHQFIRQLQKAGYATDPHYADKVIKIFERDEFTELTKTMMDGIKSSTLSVDS